MKRRRLDPTPYLTGLPGAPRLGWRWLDAGSDGAGGGDDGSGGDGGTPPRTFTQADIDRLMGKARADAGKAAAEAARKALLADLGIEDLEAHKRERDEAERRRLGETEAERKAREKAEKERDEARQRAEAAEAKAAELERSQAFRDAAAGELEVETQVGGKAVKAKLKLNPERVAQAYRLALSQDLLDGDGATPEAALQALYKLSPEWFPTPEPARPIGGGDGLNWSRGADPGDEAARDARLRRQRIGPYAR